MTLPSRTRGGDRQLSQLPQDFRAERFAEIAEQAAAPAMRGFGEPDKRIQLAGRDALEGIGRLRLLDHPALLHDVGQAVGHPRAGGFSVAPGAAGLLVVGLDALGQVEMRDKPHVGLVDPHAERDRGYDHDTVLVDEAVLMPGAKVCIEARVIRQRGNPGVGKRGRGILDLGARQAVDDPGIACMTLGDEGPELGGRVLLVDDFIADIWPVEARHELRRVSEGEPIDDLLSGELVGGGRQRDAWNGRETLREHGQADIFGAEIVSPLRNAVRLVDRKQRDARAGEQGQAARGEQPLRRDVEQIELAGDELCLDGGGLARRQRGIEDRGLDAGLEQARDLVAHQRDQRRDHDAAALAQQRRQLIAQRLAAAGRHQHQAIAAIGNVADDLLLRAAKAGQAEHGVEQSERITCVGSGLQGGRAGGYGHGLADR